MIYHFTNSIFAFLVVSAEIKIAFIAAATDCAVPLESDAAHISVNAVVAQTKSRREFFAPEQFAIFAIRTLQHVYLIMLFIVFDFLEFKTCISVEHSADHLVENLKKQRTNKRNSSCRTQTFAVGFYAYSYRFLYQSYGFFARDIFNHLHINSRPRKDHFSVCIFSFSERFLYSSHSLLQSVTASSIKISVCSLPIFFSVPRTDTQTRRGFYNIFY